MLPQHVFSHQQQFPHGDPAWQQLHQQQQQQQQSHHHHGPQHSAAAQAAAQAQQQHYNRIAANGSGSMQQAGGERGAGFSGAEHNTTLEESKIVEWIVQLLDQSTREQALLELSKKREQFPQLALILWHTFGSPIRA